MEIKYIISKLETGYLLEIEENGRIIKRFADRYHNPIFDKVMEHIKEEPEEITPNKKPLS
jgi:hypothetical protein